jgi:hypothetical protein
VADTETTVDATVLDLLADDIVVEALTAAIGAERRIQAARRELTGYPTPDEPVRRRMFLDQGELGRAFERLTGRLDRLITDVVRDEASA